jgi:hypothetical protein
MRNNKVVQNKKITIILLTKYKLPKIQTTIGFDLE